MSEPLPEEARTTRTDSGATLGNLAEQSDLLLVFLRHTGCTFCREALADLAARRAAIESRGVRIVLAHPGSREQAAGAFARYGLDDLARISDPECRLYRAFGLKRGTLWQLFGPKVAWRGLQAGLLAGHGIGRLAGNGFQMPGVFLIAGGRIAAGYRHRTAADRPDYAALAVCEPGVEGKAPRG
ncbi:MAG: SelL-related redox protein [Bryobacteraceae bacterium]